MKVKVIANKPLDDAYSIEPLIGREYEAKRNYLHGEYDGTISVVEPEAPYGGTIVLQKDEFKIIE